MSRFMKVMIVLLAVAVFATPAMADYKFSVYGSARVSTFYNDWDGTESFDIANQGNSRFGLRGSKGPVSGHVEMAVASNAISTRLMYGTYKFNGGHFMFGQNYGAFGTMFLSSQAHASDNGFIGWGAMYEGRKAFVKVGLDNGFAIWFSQTNQQGISGDAEIPKLAVSYTGKVEKFSYHAAVGYQSNEVVDDSIVGAFTGTVDLNPASVTFSAGYARNAGTYGISGQSVAPTADEETIAISATVEAGFKLNASNKLVAGVGYIQEDNDAYAQTEKRYSVFIQDQITVAPGFIVVPEVSYYEVLDSFTGNSDNETKTWHVGAKWQINF